MRVGSIIIRNGVLLAIILGLSSAASAETSSSQPLRIGIVSSLPIKAAYEYYSPLLKYMERKLERPVEMVLREKQREFDDLLRQGNIAAAFISPQFSMKNRMMSDLEFLVTSEIDSEPYYYTYIIVRKKSGISNVADLRGKRFALGKPEFALADLAPLPSIAGEINISTEPGKFFSAIHYVQNLQEALYLTTSGQIDGANVDSISYNYSIKKKLEHASETTILFKSLRMPAPPFVVKKSMELMTKERLKEILLNMHIDREGRTILNDLGFDKFSVPNISIYRKIK